MKPANLTEWAEALRIGPDSQLADFASEVLELIVSQDRLEFLEDVAADIHYQVKDFQDDTGKAVGWLIDREALLGDLEETLVANGFEGKPDDAVKALLDELEDLRAENEALKAELNELQAPAAMEYDL